jgi:(S)-ureidoglycine aminohydrolase
MADTPKKPASPLVCQDRPRHHLGHTRTSLHADHALLTPDSFVRTTLPGMKKATAIVHTAPPMGAAFTQYTAELEAGGELGPCAAQRFLFILDGEIRVLASGKNYALQPGGYAFFPAALTERVSAPKSSRIAVIEKKYQPVEGVRAPSILISEESAAAPQPFMSDDSLAVRTLLPDHPSHDFAVNTMLYQPGATLPMVESHVMEHGLLMLEGEGIYRLGNSWYPVAAGDFIWMAPYCPQWFGALGKVPAKYLIYKPWNRHPLE